VPCNKTGLVRRHREAFALLVLMKLHWTNRGLAEGLRCYRVREFFAAHEHWETVWLATEEPEKSFLQALISGCGGVPPPSASESTRHYVPVRESTEPAGALSGIVWRCLLTSFREEIREWLRVLEAGGATAHLAIPKIRVDEE
jgi:hypothetical protein